MKRIAASSEERFWRYADKRGEDECWLWIGTKSSKTGYGNFAVRSPGGAMRTVLPHRFSYGLVHGAIGRGMHIDHLCRTRLCVNPLHLEAVSPRTNTLRGISPAAVNATKVACARGHAFDLKNTYIDPSRGNRQCRECHRLRHLGLIQPLVRAVVSCNQPETERRKSGPKPRALSDWYRIEATGCWTWRGYINKHGYGEYREGYKGRSRRAYKWVYEQVLGDVPAGLSLDHLCRNRSCVNPAHLEPVTQSENAKRVQETFWC